MLKTIPLIQAILKEFIRNWKSVFMLIVFPLVFISMVFLSFNPDGIQKIPVGIAGKYANFSMEDYKDTYFYYLSLTSFESLDGCLDELKGYKQYACIQIMPGSSITLNVYYDNTREPVIWEIIERIKSTVDMLQKQKSKQMASTFLTKFSENTGKIDDFRTKLATANSRVNSYIYDADASIIKLENTKDELSNALAAMGSDIQNLKHIRNNLKRQKDNLYSSSFLYTSGIDNSARNLVLLGHPVEQPYLDSIRNQVISLNNQMYSYNSVADSALSELDSRIMSYDEYNRRGLAYLSDIDSEVMQLKTVKNELSSYKQAIGKADDEIAVIHQNFNEILGLDAETLVNPIIIRNNPAYVPTVSKELQEQYLNKTGQDQAKVISKGINLISLQTIFPTMLLLITLFLSLLISSFTCLSTINSSVHERLRLVRRIFVHEILSVYIASLIIMAMPIFCVLLLGNYLFKIPIFDNYLFILIVLFMLASVFIFVGMMLAYLIKKESITLVVVTFILAFLIFFSGFLLPVERMSKLAYSLAPDFPVKIVHMAFNKIVFYGRDFSSVKDNFFWLSIWFASLAALVFLIKKIREV
ncbi:MAG: ABC transporter permease [Nanoarchaeota archaeon]